MLDGMIFLNAVEFANIEIGTLKMSIRQHITIAQKT